MANSTIKTLTGINTTLDRAYRVLPTYLAPYYFKVAINTPDCSFSDTDLTTKIPISGTESVDDCNVTTGWTASASDSVSVNATTFKPDSGTDGALNLIKVATDVVTVTAAKTTTTINGTLKDLLAWLYIKDTTALAKLLSSGTACVVRFGANSNDYYYKNYTAADFSTGWNFKKIAIPSGFTGTSGTPTIATLPYTYLAFVTNAVTNTFAAGDVVFDSIRVASADDYYKVFDSTTFNTVDGSVSIVTKLSVSEANGFLINGHGIFNNDTAQRIDIKSKFPENSKGTSDLFKFTTKIKARNKNQ